MCKTKKDWIDWYKEFSSTEYNDDRDIPEEQTEFPMMFSTFEYTDWSGEEVVHEEEEHEIQMTYYTDPIRVVVYVDGEEVYSGDIKDYDELLEDVAWCGFQEFYDWATNMADLAYNAPRWGSKEIGKIWIEDAPMCGEVACMYISTHKYISVDNWDWEMFLNDDRNDACAPLTANTVTQLVDWSGKLHPTKTEMELYATLKKALKRMI